MLQTWQRKYIGVILSGEHTILLKSWEGLEVVSGHQNGAQNNNGISVVSAMPIW